MRTLALLILVAAVNFAPTDYVWLEGYGWIRAGQVFFVQSPGDSGAASAAAASSSGGSGGGHGH